MNLTGTVGATPDPKSGVTPRSSAAGYRALSQHLARSTNEGELDGRLVVARRSSQPSRRPGCYLCLDAIARQQRLAAVPLSFGRCDELAKNGGVAVDLSWSSRVGWRGCAARFDAQRA